MDEVYLLHEVGVFEDSEDVEQLVDVYATLDRAQEDAKNYAKGRYVETDLEWVPQADDEWTVSLTPRAAGGEWRGHGYEIQRWEVRR